MLAEGALKEANVGAAKSHCTRVLRGAMFMMFLVLLLK